MAKKAAAWFTWTISSILLLYEFTARWLGRLSVPDDLVTYIIAPARDSVLPFLRVWVTPMLTWDTARWALFVAASLTLVWVYFGDRLSSWVGAKRLPPAPSGDASIQELREKIRRLLLLLAGGDPNNERPNEINNLWSFIKESKHPAWNNLQLEQWRTDLVLLVPVSKNLRGSPLGLYSSRGERDDMLGRLRECAEKIDAKLAGYGSEPGDSVPMPPTPATLHFPAGLYVGNMRVNTEHLAKKRLLEIVIIGFNGTGATISAGMISGNAIYRKEIEGSLGDRVQLPRAELAPDLGAAGRVESPGEMTIGLRQQLSRELSDEILALLAKGERFHLYFEAMNVEVRQAGAPGRTARFPIWDRVSVGKHPNSIFTIKHRAPLVAETGRISLNPGG